MSSCFESAKINKKTPILENGQNLLNVILYDKFKPSIKLCRLNKDLRLLIFLTGILSTDLFYFDSAFTKDSGLTFHSQKLSNEFDIIIAWFLLRIRDFVFLGF